MPAGNKLLIAFLLCLIPSIFLWMSGRAIEGLTRIMIGWDIFSLSLIVMSAITFFTMKPRQIKLLVKLQDSSRIVVFIIIVVATFSSLLGILILLLNKEKWLLNKYIETIIYISGVNFSWLLLHTIFTYRYAHLYYDENSLFPGKLMAGLEMPEERYPDYLLIFPLLSV